MTQNPLESDRNKPRILIAGETAGTGASTTSKFLAEQLNLPVISGGKYFRALANHFNVFQQQYPHLSTDEQYQSFLNTYQQTFSQDGIDGVTALMAEGISQGAKGDVLATFSAVISDNQKVTGQIDTVWDYIVDQKTISDALQQPGFIWESKLAVISLELDQMQPVIAQYSAFALPYLRVLLSLDPAVAAERVAQRENRQVDVEEILVRKQRDFDRYGDLYQINGQRVAHQDLSRFADVVVSTEKMTPEEVASEILKAYLQKISLLGQTELSFTLPAVNEINRVLQELQDK